MRINMGWNVGRISKNSNDIWLRAGDGVMYIKKYIFIVPILLRTMIWNEYFIKG